MEGSSVLPPKETLRAGSKHWLRTPNRECSLHLSMKPNDVRELFEYLIETRSRFLERFREIGWAEFTKTRGATWDSMMAILARTPVDSGRYPGGGLGESPG